MDMDSAGVYRILLVMGFGLCLIGALNTYRRASFIAQGTIISSSTNCLGRSHTRCTSTYVFMGDDGLPEKYVAVPAVYSLPKELPVGTKVEKKKWHLTYSINGIADGGYSVASYVGLFVMGAFLMAYAAVKNARL